jgi:hypothetical protein
MTMERYYIQQGIRLKAMFIPMKMATQTLLLLVQQISLMKDQTILILVMPLML